MKILLYIPIEDAVKGKIDPNNYSLHTNINNINELVQVSITSDEFARLLDTTYSQSTEALIARHKTKLSSELPETNELETRIYKESQSITGEEFSNWYNGLTSEEKQTYKNIYGH
jgi:hypothetical protein